MGTNVRRNLSTKNRYYLPKHRRLELEHFCLQYNDWKKEINALNAMPVCHYQEVKGSIPSDPTAKTALRSSYFKEKCEMVERSAKECDPDIGKFIFESVTTGKPFSYFEAKGIPCGRDMFYDRLRKFYWILDKYRR